MSKLHPGRPGSAADLLDRLTMAEETLRALRSGEVDALMVEGADGKPQIYTLETADFLYRRLVERMTEGAGLLDADGYSLFVNQRLAQMVALPAEQTLGLPFAEWIDSPGRDRFAQWLHEAGTEGQRAEFTLCSVLGDRIPVLLGLGLASESERLIYCLTVTDLTTQKAQDERVNRLNSELSDRLVQLRKLNADLHQTQRMLVHRNLHDALTGLPNRTLFLDRLTQALGDSVRTGQPVGVCFVDLDGFKRINDTLGHTAGDRVLREVAARLMTVIRPGDTVARFAGDEFLVLTPSLDNAGQGQAVANRLLAATLNPPIALDGSLVTASIGVAVSSSKVGPEQLVQQADAAMYVAKKRGGRRLEVFGAALRREIRHRVTTENKLRKALAADGLRVHYQAIIDLAGRQPLGAEALVRMVESDGSLTPPDEFIRTAEECGLVLPLGRWVLEEACRQPPLWEVRSHRPWYVSVNVSPRQLQDGNLVSQVMTSLDLTEMSADRLRLEITESGLIEVGSTVVGTLRRLRDLGVQIGVDDFGTGYASMSYVRHLPLDFVKIDQGFVSGMLTDSHDLAMVEATLALTDRLQLDSVAEGIETEEQAELLRSLGCTAGQGFLFAKPTPAELVCG